MKAWINITLLLILAIHSNPIFAAINPDSTNQWGYGYDSLIKDLNIWRLNPLTKIDSVGSTSKGRAIWMVSITDSGDSLVLKEDSKDRKHRIFIHARTHPSEVQANYVANEAIRFLLDTTEVATKLRAGFIFNIIPMYNPDGVEEGHPRLNGNGVNLEVNWNVPQPEKEEKEVMALRKLFESFMAGPIPIEVALNLHSDQYNYSRFFWFHNAGGTSARYTDLQKAYIAKVQAYFPGGIKDWYDHTSWNTEPGLIYPEGFWWKNYQEAVMALTYEDINGPIAGKFDSTARALVLGSADYIRNRIAATIKTMVQANRQLLIEPNGVRILGYSIGKGKTTDRWRVMDLMGRAQAGGLLGPGDNFLPWKTLASPRGGILVLTYSSGTPLTIRLPAQAP